MNDSIFGYTFEQIRDWQQRKQPLLPILNTHKPELLPGDLELLEEHGVEGLNKMQFFGVLDRLKNNGIIL